MQNTRIHQINRPLADLLRCANLLDRISDYEKLRVLDCGIHEVETLRARAGIPRDWSQADHLISVQITANLLERGFQQNEKTKASMLKAAELIRNLTIHLHAVGKSFTI